MRERAEDATRVLDALTDEPEFFLAHELLQVVGYQPDVPALAKAADRLIFAIGDTSRQYRLAFPAIVLAPSVGAGLVEFPGSHAGYLDASGPFAETLLAVLAGHERARSRWASPVGTP